MELKLDLSVGAIECLMSNITNQLHEVNVENDSCVTVIERLENEIEELKKANAEKEKAVIEIESLSRKMIQDLKEKAEEQEKEILKLTMNMFKK